MEFVNHFGGIYYNKIMESFGERLKELRKEKNLTIMELSKEINYSKSIIGYWEQNKKEPTMSAIKTLCDYFNVSADYLICLKDDSY